MKFDFCIGNPPYQETKGETKNVDIWPSFVEESTKIANCSALIHPGRWLIPKKQMEPIHKLILDSGLICFNYYPDASILFTGKQIDGGVTVTIFRNGVNNNPIKYYRNDEYLGIYSETEMFFSNQFEAEAYEKIHVAFPEAKSIEHRVLGNVGSLSGVNYLIILNNFLLRKKSCLIKRDMP